MTESPEAIIAAQKAQCPFCKIVSGEIPATKVYEDKHVLAIMDINPAVPGHVIVLPKEHYPILPFLPPDVFAHLFAVVRDMSRAIKKGTVTNASSVFIANGGAAGQQSSHFLVHLFGREKGDSLTKVLTGKSSAEAKEKNDELVEALKHNLGTMLANAKLPDIGLPKKIPVSEDQKKKLAAFIEQNESFRETLIKDPASAQAMINQSPELQALMQGVDIMRLHERLKEAYR